jgi:hypothetical protein
VNANNLPKGTKVSLEDTHDKLKSLSTALSVSSLHNNKTVRATVPPKHEGELKVTIKTPDGGVLPGNSSVEVVQYWHVTPDDEHYLDAVKQTGDIDALARQEPVEVRMGEYTFAGEAYGKN